MYSCRQKTANSHFVSIHFYCSRLTSSVKQHQFKLPYLDDDVIIALVVAYQLVNGDNDC